MHNSNLHDRIARVVIQAIQRMDPPTIQLTPPVNIRQIAISEQLDSLGLVSLIMVLEETLKKEFNQEVVLLGPVNALGGDHFKTSGALIDYIEKIMTK